MYIVEWMLVHIDRSLAMESGWLRLGTEPKPRGRVELQGQDHRSVAIHGLGSSVTKVNNWHFVPVTVPPYVETTLLTSETGSMPTRRIQDNRQVGSMLLGHWRDWYCSLNPLMPPTQMLLLSHSFDIVWH